MTTNAGAMDRIIRAVLVVVLQSFERWRPLERPDHAGHSDFQLVPCQSPVWLEHCVGQLG